MSNIIYLVTGAAVFLESNVCSQLLERGEKVKALVTDEHQCRWYQKYH